jgi:hypothetical protein
MENSKSTILSDLLNEIGKKEFDLEAWKMKAVMVFKMFFGPGDEKIGFIKNLRYDYSSWALRDSAGGKQPDTVKENARRIIETALLEISLSEKSENLVFDTIKEELTGKEYSSLMTIIKKSGNLTSCLDEYFGNLESSKKEQILTKLVLNSIKK